MGTKNDELIEILKGFDVESYNINYEYQLHIDPLTKENTKILDFIRIELFAKKKHLRHGN